MPELLPLAGLCSWKTSAERNKRPSPLARGSFFHVRFTRVVACGTRVGNGRLSRPESKPFFWETDLKAVGLLGIIANARLPKS